MNVFCDDKKNNIIKCKRCNVRNFEPYINVNFTF